MPSPLSKSLGAAIGGVVAAIGAAMCCAGPLVAVFLGLSGAGLAAAFEPLRPFFVAGTVLSLGGGFMVLRREERRACQPGTACVSPTTHRWMKRWLWIATIVAIPLVTFPWWSRLILG